MGTVVDFPVHRRRHPRVTFDQPVALVHKNSTVVTVQGVNISQSGLQAIADRYTVDSLVRYENPLSAQNSPAVDAHFRLAVDHEMLKVDAHCRLVYVFEMEDRKHALGLSFEYLAPASRDNLLHFLNSSRLMSQV